MEFQSIAPQQPQKPWKWLIIGGVILILVIGGVWWLRNRDPGADWQGQAAPATSEKSPAQATGTQKQPEAIVYPVDTDGDAVSDADEKTQGTDPNKADSDGDGHSDFEEIYSDKTNPLQADPPRAYPGTTPAAR